MELREHGCRAGARQRVRTCCYGYTRERLELTGDYRFTTRVSAAAGYEHESRGA